jgi:Sigma-54 interaction domain
MAKKKTASYIGWSLAAMNFRRMMNDRAVNPVSMLIVGEPGTGKRTMAEAWREASGAKELPIVNLDDSSAEIPDRCVAISTRPIRTRVLELQPINLENLHLVSDCELEGEPISESHLKRFVIKLLVPPLRQRRMDILAVLHSYAGQPSLQYTEDVDEDQLITQPCVNSQMIYRMFLDAVWAGNLRTLTDCLVMAIMSASKRSGPKIIGEGDLKIVPSTEPTTHATQLVPPLRPTITGRKTERRRLPLWDCDGVDISLDRLPFVAVSILLNAFWKNLENSELNPEPVYRLGNDSRWATDERFDDVASTMLAKTSVSKLFEQWNWGFTMDDAKETHIIPKLEHFTSYGATLASLQDGFRVSGDTSVKPAKLEIKKRNRKLRTKPTSKQIKVVSLVDLRDLTFPQAAEEMGLNSRQAAEQLYKRGKEIMEGGDAGSSYRERPKIARDENMKRKQDDDDD